MQSQITLSRQAARSAWLAADDAWSAELVRVFGGKIAGDMRYTMAGRGMHGSKLRELHDAFEASRAAYEAAVSAQAEG